MFIAKIIHVSKQCREAINTLISSRLSEESIIEKLVLQINKMKNEITNWIETSERIILLKKEETKKEKRELKNETEELKK